jgi:large subunit ribosomal protein L9
MKIILLQDVKKVGVKGAVIEVADGYAQNVLLPRKLALPATAASIKQHEQESLKAGERKATDAGLAKSILGKLDGQTVTMHGKAGETGTLFVAIHEKDIVAAIEKELGFSIPESAITLDEPIKKTGEHRIALSLMGAEATIKVLIVG